MALVLIHPKTPFTNHPDTCRHHPDIAILCIKGHWKKNYIRHDMPILSSLLVPSNAWGCLGVSGWCVQVSGWCVKGVLGCINTKYICKRAYKVIYCFFFKYTYAL